MLDRPDAQEFVRHTNAVLGAIARALEQFASDDNLDSHEQIQEVYLSLQKIIFRYRAISGRLRSREQFDESIQQTFEELSEFFEKRWTSYV